MESTNNYLNINQMDSSFDSYYKDWARAHAGLVVLGTAIVAYRDYHWWVAGLIVFGSFGDYLYRLPKFGEYAGGIGWANRVTLLRLVIIFGIFLGYRNLTDIQMLIGFSVVILLDGVDGFVARKLNIASRPGEVFDMETDAFMVLVMSYIHVNSGKVDMWLMIAGAARYFYEGLSIMLPPNDFPPKRVRSTFAVTFFVSLLFPFIFEKQVYLPAVQIGSIGVLTSFLLSIGYGVVKSGK